VVYDAMDPNVQGLLSSSEELRELFKIDTAEGR
jgi:hypothetical protein